MGDERVGAVQLSVEIETVVAAAAVIVGLSLGMTLVCRRRGMDRPALLLIASSLGFLTAALGVFLRGELPFVLSSTLVIGGALGGIVLAYLGIGTALGAPLHRWRWIAGGAAAMVVAQAALAASAEDVVPLMFSSSAVNGTAATVMAIAVWRRVRGLGGALPLFLALPFAAFAMAYMLRLVIFAAAPGMESYLLGTAVIILAMAMASLLWVFGLVTLREVQAGLALTAARQRVETASRAKSDFLRSLSHELRTPLNAVVGFSELMRRESMGPLPDRYRDAAEHIHIAGRHLNDLIEDLLDLSVIEAGRLRLEETDVPADEIVTAAIAIIAKSAETAGVRIERRDIAPGHLVRVDRRRMVQALVNLLGNATKFAPEESSVTIGTILPERGGLAFFVSDDGRGMTSDELAEAMTLFGRLRRGGDMPKKGIGVGLPLTRELAEAHGGRLAIESAPQAGTLARIELPQDRVLGKRRAASAAEVEELTGIGAGALDRRSGRVAEPEAG